MRILCLILMFLAALMSVFLGFSLYNESEDIKEYEKGIFDVNIIKNTYTSETAVIEADIQTLSSQKDMLAAELDSIKRIMRYKTERIAFLTFDDGPSSNTTKILDILAENNIKGTFFIVGKQIEGYSATAPSILKRIIEEGHTLAIHAYSHEYATIYASKEAYLNDLDKVKNQIYEMTGYSPDIVRMPGGTASAESFLKKNLNSDTAFKEMLDEVLYRGYMVTDWNVDTKDYTTATGVSGIIENAVSGARARLSATYKASIILMHETKDTVSALPSIIKGVQELGYYFEPLVNGGYSYRQR